MRRCLSGSQLLIGLEVCIKAVMDYYYSTTIDVDLDLNLLLNYMSYVGDN